MFRLISPPPPRIPFTVVIFYLLSPLPTLIAKRQSDDSTRYYLAITLSLALGCSLLLMPSPSLLPSGKPDPCSQLQPLPGARLVPDHWYRGVSLRLAHSAGQGSHCSHATSHTRYIRMREIWSSVYTFQKY